ncbi:endonuclease/exonuclease/phosphatase family protein [Streptomyces peucetius]|uniref:Endonuclease/exonuclease/phosphatase family protein n=1 Tax=Streptomyces peucetius TaxID=1950 RepID=A0ABY6IGG4_STRPE|nr:endonuclease/exonuclease/phosphatase family protein [Streptomyces peucetius]UYQ66101.1 endonuclease/exonuclease/phosphatase family protein [Streptomyces peucetius]
MNDADEHDTDAHGHSAHGADGRGAGENGSNDSGRDTGRRRFRLPRRGSRGTDRRGRSRFGRGRVIAALAVIVACLLAFHSAVPNAVGRFGSLLETFLPWLGLAVPVLLTAALLRRSVTALIALLLPAAAWLGLFGALLLPPPGGPAGIVAVQHNVSDVNADPAGTARALLRVRPDLVALEEVTPSALPAYRKALGRDMPHHAVVGTVGLWSRHPLKDVRPVDIKPREIGPGWNRGMRATVLTPRAEVAVHVAHLPSVRIGGSGFSSAWRDESARLLGAALAAEQPSRLILLGDLNGTVDDRGLDPVLAHVGVAGPGFAFSWPASFPLARIDQILARSAKVTHVRSLPATGSDHLPIVARITL